MIREEDLLEIGFKEYPADRGLWWVGSNPVITGSILFDQLSGELHIEDEVDGMTIDTLLSLVNSKEELEQVLETLLI